MDQVSAPKVIDEAASAEFRSFATRLGEDPDSQWVGAYVEYQWEHCRYLLDHTLDDFQDKKVLEFGCNVGATAIVLAQLGANVTAVDVDKDYVELARLNAARYGLADAIDFRFVEDTREMPFPAGNFDMVTCMSVLEYIPKELLSKVMKEIDRVLAQSGLIFITGTSNRLWPREQHSGKWWVNYLPSVIDRQVFGKAINKGVFPWRITRGFGAYRNTHLEEQGAAYLNPRERRGIRAIRLRALRMAARALQPLGCSVGLLTPNISVTLRKL